MLEKNVCINQSFRPLSEVECHEWIGNVWWNTKSFIIDNISFLSSFSEAPAEIGSGTSGIVYRVGSIALKISAHKTPGVCRSGDNIALPRIAGNGLRVYSEGSLSGSTFPGYMFKYRFMELLKNETTYSIGLSQDESSKLFSSIDFLIDSNFGLIPEKISQLMYIDDLLITNEVVNFILNDDIAASSVGVINEHLSGSLTKDWVHRLVEDYLLLLDLDLASDISYHNLGLREGPGGFVFFDIED